MKKLLIALLLFLGITAAMGGIQLIRTNGMGMPMSSLQNTPFSSFIMPGFILLFIVGGTSLLAAFLHIKNHKYAIEASVTAGFGIQIWVTTELFMLTHRSFLQAIFFTLGVIILILSMFLLKKSTHK